MPTRLFAAEPVNNALATDSLATDSLAADSLAKERAIRVEVFERAATGSVLASWLVNDASEIGPLIETIVATPMGMLKGQTVVDRPTFLVCTQGSHDVCCGAVGVDFADELERERPDYDVRRVSHTGGHRFAPTLLALPDGRMWAFVDLALADRIAQRTETPEDFRLRSRGWWGAKVGYAQVAETAVQVAAAEQVTEARSLEAVELEPGRNLAPESNGAEVHSFVAQQGARTWSINVTVGRAVPSISCESPGGLPVKPGREFAWSITES